MSAAGDPWREHEERGGALLAAARADRRGGPFGPRYVTLVRQLERSPPAVLGSALMLLLQPRPPLELEELTRSGLLGRPLQVTREDALLAGGQALRALRGSADWRLRATIALTLLERTSDDARPDDGELVRRLLARFDAEPFGREQGSAVRDGLVSLLPPPAAGEIDTTAIRECDAWAEAVGPRLREVGTSAAAAEQVGALLRALGTARGTRPTDRWLAEVGTVLRSAAARAALRVLVDAMATAPPRVAHWDIGGEVIHREQLLQPPNGELARAAVWAAIALRDEEEVLPVLGQIAERGIRGARLDGDLLSAKVVNAAILALGRIATPDAAALLQRLLATTTHSGYRTRLSAALDEAAATLGIPRSSLVEQSVDPAGLDPDGTATWTSGAVVLHVRLDDDLRVVATWEGSPRPSSPPAEGAATDVAALRRRVNSLKTAVSAERRRVEDLLASDRTWAVDDWRRAYLDHPITGRIGRRLLWRITTPDGAVRTGLPLRPGLLTTLEEEESLPGAGTVGLWHVATSSTEEVAAWRDRLVAAAVTQPFAQVFREVYLLTPAEQETGTYSNRFAAHVLRYRQLYALLKGRGWRADHLGPYDGGDEAVARRDLVDAGLSAHFRHLADPVALQAGALDVDLATSDRVWFSRSGDRGREPVPLVDVPPLAFSEVMRDVDLFTSVASIAMDPTWADRRDAPWFPYWEASPTRDFPPSAVARREALARLLPKLAFADRLELRDRYVRVRGRRHTYQVFLASAHILIEPDSRYLCIVRGGRGPQVSLPFDGDEILSIVLSKVALLVRDDEITAPDIVAQLEDRGSVLGPD